MGRQPAPIITRYFERGEKLPNNTNRYRHRCRACGEDFNKGRHDTMIAHLTKKCPAISEADRVRACLMVHGIDPSDQQDREHLGSQLLNTPTSPPNPDDSNWRALDTLAEVGSRFAQNEGKKDRARASQTLRRKSQSQNASSPLPVGSQNLPSGSLYQFRVELNQPDMQSQPHPEPGPGVAELQMLQEAPPSVEQAASQAYAVPDQSSGSVAATTTAQLNASLVDPQILSEQTPQEAYQGVFRNQQDAVEPVNSRSVAPLASAEGMMQMPDQPPLSHASGSIPAISPPTRGGMRIDMGPVFPRKHMRSRFDADRRQQVKEVRRLGACARCKILRKNCSAGNPCDQCRKVLSPRVWRTGCVRTKNCEQLDLYSAGVQVVLARTRASSVKGSHTLVEYPGRLELGHFADVPTRLCLSALQRSSADSEGNVVPNGPVVMLDVEGYDIPCLVEKYMTEILKTLIDRESTAFIKTTLKTIQQLLEKNEDKLLRQALHLWGLVELLDRERQWSIVLRPGEPGAVSVTTVNKAAADGEPPSTISDRTDVEAYATICIQLSGVIERRACASSKALLTGLQRSLQDSKIQPTWGAYLASVVLLNCIEKTTWSFKAWEQPNLRPSWPLEKEPQAYSEQGYVLAEVMHMLLAIRKVLPRTARRDEDGVLVTLEEDEFMRAYFESLNLNFDHVRSKQQRPSFQPTNSRCLEFMFTSILLLPREEQN